MIASIVWDVDPILFKVGSWEVRWYGLMWGLGFILAYEMVSRLFKKEKYPEEWVDKLFVYCIVSTVIGAVWGIVCFMNGTIMAPILLKYSRFGKAGWQVTEGCSPSFWL